MDPLAATQNDAFATAVAIWKTVKSRSPIDIGAVAIGLQKTVASYLHELDELEKAWNSEFGQRRDGVMQSQWTNYRQFAKWRDQEMLTHHTKLGRCAVAHNNTAISAASQLGMSMTVLGSVLKP